VFYSLMITDRSVMVIRETITLVKHFEHNGVPVYDYVLTPM